jgi:hypothetical protein
MTPKYRVDGAKISHRRCLFMAGMAELADALDLGSSALKACRFKSCSRHQQIGL